jgi:hypothetical protein
MASSSVPLLLITGAPASGKTTAGEQIRHLLEQAGASFGLVDCDEISPDGLISEDRMVILARRLDEHLAAGAATLVVVWPLQSRDEVEAFRAALPWADVTVCRLHAETDVLLDRIRARDDRTFMAAHLASMALDIAPRLQREAPEDIVLATDHEPPLRIAGRALVHWGLKDIAAPRVPA